MADTELVIKIPENIIECAKSNSNYYPIYNFGKIWRAIANGTPLPKGHGELMDKNFVIQAKITRDNNGVFDRTKGWNEACQAIFENTPTVIEADKEESEVKK